MMMIKSRMRWVGYVAGLSKKRNTHKNSSMNIRMKSPFGRPMHRWENNITMDLQKTEWDGMDMIHLTEDRRVTSVSCEHSSEPLRSTKKCNEILD
jgi:hypothetical protein